MRLYRQESGYPKVNAQVNLAGRTHYVDDDTLRFHKSRVISARHTDNGLLFYLVTSDALDYQNTTRGFRYVIFDLFGTVLERTEREQAYRTSAQATKAMWRVLNDVDAVAVTRAAIEQARENYASELARVALDVDHIESSTKAAADLRPAS